MGQEMKGDVLEARLQGGREVLVVLLDRLSLLTRPAARGQRSEAHVERRDRETALVSKRHDGLQGRGETPGIAVGSQAHDLVLVEETEAQVLDHGYVEHAEGIRRDDVCQPGDPAVGRSGDETGVGVAPAIEGDDQRLVVPENAKALCAWAT